MQLFEIAINENFAYENRCGEKKFTLPDNSIPVSGRMVQCGFCGIKWKQFPVNEIKKSKSNSSFNDEGFDDDIPF